MRPDGRGFPALYRTVRSLAPLLKKKYLLCFASTVLPAFPSPRSHHTARLHRSIHTTRPPPLRRPPFSLHAPPHRSLPAPWHPCVAAASTELASLYDGCSSKEARGGASRDAAPLTSCPCHCRTGELHAPPPTFVPASSSAMRSLHSSEQQSDIKLKAHVASVCFKCFRCFI